MKLKIIHIDETQYANLLSNQKEKETHVRFNVHAFRVITDTCVLVSINFTETVKTNS